MSKGISTAIIIVIVLALVSVGAVSLQLLKSEVKQKVIEKEAQQISQPKESQPIQTVPTPQYITPSQELTPTTTTTKIKADQCGNEIGNGNQIVSGPSGPEGPDRDNPFRSLTIHPTNPDIILIGTERNGFVKSNDGGKTWERFRYGLRHQEEGYPEIYDISIAASNTDVIYAATTGGGPGPLVGNYPSAFGGIYKSIDGGKTWERKNCGILSGWVWSIYVDPNNPDYVIAGVSGGKSSFFVQGVTEPKFYEGGLFVTNDGGDNWNKVNIADNDGKNVYSYIRVLKSNPSVLYAFGYNFEDANLNIGFIKSTDNGKTWAQFAHELKSLQISSFDVSSDGNTIYAISDSETRRELLKSSDGGKTWSSYELRSSGYTITISPADKDRVLFGRSDGLYLSTDGLKTEIKVIENTENRFSDVAFVPSNNNIVYAITQGYILYKSTDGGNAFTKIKDIRNEVLNVIS